MRKIERLKVEAKESVEWRGHNVGRWQRLGMYGYPVLVCRNCYATVSVTDRPAPNQCEISGDAVAVHCPAGS